MKICPPEHKHSETGTCYVQHKCRCSDCRAGQNARERRRQRLKAYGRWDHGLVDAGPAREHLLMLREFGMGYETVAKAAGVGKHVTRTLLYGRDHYVNGEHGPRHGEAKKRISRANAEAILRVQPDLSLLGSRVSVPGLGTRRRLQALMCLGWSMSKLAARLDMHASNFSRVILAERVWAGTARAVAALYDELWDTPAPREAHRDRISFNRAVKYAQDRGWVPPLAWDCIDTDPAPVTVEDSGTFDEVAVELAISGERVALSQADRVEVVRRMSASGWSNSRIAEVVRSSTTRVREIRTELGLTREVAA